jgi:hypothetical protein
MGLRSLPHSLPSSICKPLLRSKITGRMDGELSEGREQKSALSHSRSPLIRGQIPQTALKTRRFLYSTVLMRLPQL